eukprot:jgi/Psemu1/318576/estExt_fgenesh1_pm.C_930016
MSIPIDFDKVAIIGSGNWGSAIATVIGSNCARHESLDTTVNMYVHQERITLEDGTTGNISDIINERHENVKYLPGISIPENVVAIPDLAAACKDATLLIFVTPHQFLMKMLPVIAGSASPNSRGINLIKGIDFDHDRKQPVLISKIISRAIGNQFECGSLMGANVAWQVANGEMCEATLACDFGHLSNERTRKVFDAPLFRVQHIHDVAGAEVAGALKNIVAIGAGFVDALGMGGNTKAALIRVGLLEMVKFGKLFFSGIRNETWVESCGVADLITTCYGGRNRKCAEAFAKEGLREQQRENKNEGGDKTKTPSVEERCQERWVRIEKELLNGQKLQGTLTTKEVYTTLNSRGDYVNKFPLMKTIYEISFEGRPIPDIIDGIRVSNASADAMFY